MSLKEKIVNGITGEITWRDYSPEEILEIENNLKQLEKEIAESNKKQKIRASALAKLAALGLTEEEIAAF